MIRFSTTILFYFLFSLCRLTFSFFAYISDPFGLYRLLEITTLQSNESPILDYLLTKYPSTENAHWQCFLTNKLLPCTTKISSIPSHYDKVSAVYIKAGQFMLAISSYIIAEAIVIGVSNEINIENVLTISRSIGIADMQSSIIFDNCYLKRDVTIKSLRDLTSLDSPLQIAFSENTRDVAIEIRNRKFVYKAVETANKPFQFVLMDYLRILSQNYNMKANREYEEMEKFWSEEERSKRREDSLRIYLPTPHKNYYFGLFRIPFFSYSDDPQEPWKRSPHFLTRSSSFKDVVGFRELTVKQIGQAIRALHGAFHSSPIPHTLKQLWVVSAFHYLLNVSTDNTRNKVQIEVKHMYPETDREDYITDEYFDTDFSNESHEAIRRYNIENFMTDISGLKTTLDMSVLCKKLQVFKVHSGSSAMRDLIVYLFEKKWRSLLKPVFEVNKKENPDVEILSPLHRIQILCLDLDSPERMSRYGAQNDSLPLEAFKKKQEMSLNDLLVMIRDYALYSDLPFSVPQDCPYLFMENVLWQYFYSIHVIESSIAYVALYLVFDRRKEQWFSTTPDKYNSIRRLCSLDPVVPRHGIPIETLIEHVKDLLNTKSNPAYYSLYEHYLLLLRDLEYQMLDIEKLSLSFLETPNSPSTGATYSESEILISQGKGAFSYSVNNIDSSSPKTKALSRLLSEYKSKLLHFKKKHLELRTPRDTLRLMRFVPFSIRHAPPEETKTPTPSLPLSLSISIADFSPRVKQGGILKKREQGTQQDLKKREFALREELCYLDAFSTTSRITLFIQRLGGMIEDVKDESGVMKKRMLKETRMMREIKIRDRERKVSEDRYDINPTVLWNNRHEENRFSNLPALEANLQVIYSYLQRKKERNISGLFPHHSLYLDLKRANSDKVETIKKMIGQYELASKTCNGVNMYRLSELTIAHCLSFLYRIPHNNIQRLSSQVRVWGKPEEEYKMEHTSLSLEHLYRTQNVFTQVIVEVENKNLIVFDETLPASTAFSTILSTALIKSKKISMDNAFMGDMDPIVQVRVQRDNLISQPVIADIDLSIAEFAQVNHICEEKSLSYAYDDRQISSSILVPTPGDKDYHKIKFYATFHFIGRAISSLCHGKLLQKPCRKLVREYLLHYAIRNGAHRSNTVVQTHAFTSDNIEKMRELFKMCPMSFQIKFTLSKNKNKRRRGFSSTAEKRSSLIIRLAYGFNEPFFDAVAVTKDTLINEIRNSFIKVLPRNQLLDRNKLVLINGKQVLYNNSPISSYDISTGEILRLFYAKDMRRPSAILSVFDLGRIVYSWFRKSSPYYYGPEWMLDLGHEERKNETMKEEDNLATARSHSVFNKIVPKKKLRKEFI